jgi:DegV family protein with EDD domain
MSERRALAIVCDSTASITREEARRLGATVVPMSYIADGIRREETFVGENGDYDALFRTARILSTEAVWPTAFAEVFRGLAAQGADVLCLTISARLSGTYRSAEAAAREVTGELGAGDVPRVIAFDTWTTSAGIEFLVRRAHRLAAAGATREAGVYELDRARSAQGIVFTVPDLEVLRGSGRLGAARRAVAGKLDRYLVMGLREGGIVDLGVAHGTRGMGRLMVEQVPEGTRDLVVTHYGKRGVGARDTFAEVRRRFPKAAVRVKDGGPVVSRHLGLGSVSLAWDAPESD